MDDAAPQAAYRERRKAWAREVGRPYPTPKTALSADQAKPPPGEIDAADAE